MHHDGSVEPQPPVKRALLMIEDMLKQHGHRVIEWKPPNHADAYKIAVSIVVNYFLRIKLTKSRWRVSTKTVVKISRLTSLNLVSTSPHKFSWRRENILMPDRWLL